MISSNRVRTARAALALLVRALGRRSLVTVSLLAGAGVGALALPSAALASVTISGHVDGTVSSGSQPLAGVTIWESLDGGASWGDTGHTTDASGNYAGVAAPDTTVDLRFSHPWYQDQIVTVDLSTNTSGVATVNTTEVQDGSLAGHVTDSTTGLPAAGIAVQITSPGPNVAQDGCPSNGPCTYTEYTDQSGDWTDQVSIGGVSHPADAPGNGWTVCAPPTGVSSYTQDCNDQVSVGPSGAVTTVDLSVSELRSVSITAEDSVTGYYLSGMLATVYDGSGAAVGQCTTASGACSAEVPPEASYRIGFGASGGYPAQYYSLEAGLSCADPVSIGPSGPNNILAYLASSSSGLTPCSSATGTGTTPTTTNPGTTTGPGTPGPGTPGPGSGGPGGTAGAVQAPTVQGASESTKAWREGSALAVFSRAQAPIGTTFSFTANEASTVTYTFVQEASGRKLKGKCAGPTTRDRRAPACRRKLIAARLSQAGHAGVDRLTFDGRVSATKRLKPGHYLLVITASAAGHTSAPATLSFTIVH